MITRRWPTKGCSNKRSICSKNDDGAFGQRDSDARHCAGAAARDVWLRRGLSSAVSARLWTALQRVERMGHDYPLLSCSRCGYELSAEDVEQRGIELLRPPAKNCCSGPKAQRGSLLNFVDREVVVMELVEHGLTDPSQLQRQATDRICRPKGSKAAARAE